MNDRVLLLRDLQHLQNINTRKLINAPVLKVGFNQKRRPSHKLASLHQQSEYEKLFKVEQQLIQDLKQIDSSLQKQHLLFSYYNGFLFAQGLAHDLTGKFMHLIASRSEAVEYGFSIWRVSDQEGSVKLVGGKLSHSPPNFSHQLTQKSLEKIEQYNHQKHKQSIKQSPKPWQYFSKGPKQHLRLRTEQNMSRRQQNWDIRLLERGRYKQRTQMNRKVTYNSSTLFESEINQSYLNLKESEHSQNQGSPSKLIIAKPFSFTKILPHPSFEELHKMLNKQTKVISIWAPPSNYPQLLAVLSIQIRQKNLKTRSCYLSKYYITKHSLSRRMTNCILDYTSKEYGLIDELAATTDKITFDGVFNSQGWKIRSWINQDKVRIVYRRALL